jgi:catechol 2,3-dioxygenase-like lactoylglutathione lyase family enzyme
MTTVRFATVNIDCGDARAMAAFWGALLGWPISYEDHDFVLLRDPGGGAGLSFQEIVDYRAPTWPVSPEGQDKQAHLDLQVDDVEAAVGRALELGARLAPFQGREDLRVLLDPAGHPFCLGTE